MRKIQKREGKCRKEERKKEKRVREGDRKALSTPSNAPIGF